MDLHVTDAGSGTPVVLLHGLTATHRYVVMGSRSLERSGHRVIAYDARGHGASDPAPGGDYSYAALEDDLWRVMDERGIDRAVLAGASMGAHTILRAAIEHPERVAALVVITPAFDPVDSLAPAVLARWDALADGLEQGGVEGFVEAYDLAAVPEAWRETTATVLRQRLGAHRHLGAVADAIRGVPRSQPFATLHDLARVEAPTVVVADRDEADPGHPLSVGEAYAELIPGAELVVEEEGRSPLAWQGGQLSKVIAGLAARAA
ncbi:MAG: alpha/beta fold hydrolase [Solirubrobacteraceae bacterium]